MTIQEWFNQRKEAQIERRAIESKGLNTADTPELWTKCVHCETPLLKTEIEENLMVCPHCDYHYRISAKTRINYCQDNRDSKYDSKNTELELLTKDDPVQVLFQKVQFNALVLCVGDLLDRFKGVVKDISEHTCQIRVFYIPEVFRKTGNDDLNFLIP